MVENETILELITLKLTYNIQYIINNLNNFCIFLQSKTTGVITSLTILQTKLFNRSTGQIEVERGVSLSIWVVYIILWSFFSFASFLSFSYDFYRFWQFSFVSLVWVAVWKGVWPCWQMIMADTWKFIIYNKIAAPLSVFASDSLVIKHCFERSKP